MIIEKILNNNVVVSIDTRTKKEIILMGCGIAFKKKIGQEVDENKIEKTFTIDNKTLGDKIKKLINQIPDGIFQLVQEIIINAEVKLNRKLDKQVYISLADHIAFSIKRYKKNIVIKNNLLIEIKRIHKEEFQVGLWAVKHINKRLKIELPMDEAGFIALHIVNATYQETASQSISITNIVRDILNIIRYNFSVEFYEDDISYDRLLTHLKYFSKRVITNSNEKNSHSDFINVIKESYKDSYECSLKIKDFINKQYNYNINEDEIVYLTLHIHRVISSIKENI